MLTFIIAIILLAFAIPFIVSYTVFHILQQLIFVIIWGIEKKNDELPVLLRIIPGLIGIALLLPSFVVSIPKTISFIIIQGIFKDFKEFPEWVK